MFIITAKLPRRKLAAGLTAGLLLCAAAVSLLFFPAATAASATIPSPKKVRTAEDRIAYLEAYGWLVEPEPLAVEELLVPKEFDATYDEYLALQTAQGFDLTKYRGKKIQRYTYEILNYPTGETGVQVSLLIRKNTVIGGEVLSPHVNGFVHGLAFPEQTNTPRVPAA